MRLTEERTVLIWGLAGDCHIVLCFSANHFTLTVPLSTQVYEWVLVNLMLVGVTLPWTCIPSRGDRKVEILLVALYF